MPNLNYNTWFYKYKILLMNNLQLRFFQKELKNIYIINFFLNSTVTFEFSSQKDSRLGDFLRKGTKTLLNPQNFAKLRLQLENF